MELDRLQEFAVLANFANYTKAAQYLNMSQSALSKHITALEEELRIPLFTRSSTRVALTPQGQIALNVANVLLADYEKLKTIADNFQAVTVGGAITNTHIIETLNRAASAASTSTSLHLSYYPALDSPAQHALTTGEIDLYINYANTPVDNTIGRIALCHDAMTAFVKKGTFGDKAEIALGDLKSLYFINIVSQAFDSEFNLGWETLLHTCRDHGFIPAAKVASITSECDAQVLDIGADSCFVIATNAYAAMRLKQRADLDAIPISDAQYDYYAFYRKDNMTRGVETLLTQLETPKA